MASLRTAPAALAVLLLVVVGLAGCGERQSSPPPGAAAPNDPAPEGRPDGDALSGPPPAAPTAPPAADGEEPYTRPPIPAEPELPPHPVLDTQSERDASSVVAPVDASTGASALVVDYPFEASVFPPGFVPPTFLWQDETQADTWYVQVATVETGDPVLQRLVPGPPQPRGEIDPRAMGPTNHLYEPTPAQASAKSWTPTRATWDAIQKASVETSVRVSFVGFGHDAPGTALSRGEVTLLTSKDPVDGTLFYRDVPLMPAVGEKGKIQPLGRAFMPLIAWRTKDVTRKGSKVVLTGMRTCANCHSFSRDGQTLGMDVDGPDGDKGTYALTPIRKTTVIDYEQVMTWNSFTEKPEGHKTIGFLSSISPDGRYAITTLNEALYVANFAEHEFLQVFFPTRGILAFYDSETQEIRPLPGADDTDFVHCDPTWSPDGSTIVFARAPAQDPYVAGVPRAEYPNDPNEPRVRYDLYRIPFDEGRGGKAEAIAGASANGMSNTFPKLSPDGKWLVFVKCKNGQLMRPDGRLWICPSEGGEARVMECNLPLMNSWHSFSPNGRWMVWSSKSFTPYTRLFLTHLDDEGRASPAILVPETTASNRAANIPEFMNAEFDALDRIEVPAVRHHRFFFMGTSHLTRGEYEAAAEWLGKAVEAEPDSTRSRVNLGFALINMGKREEAFEHFAEALELAPRDVSALTNVAAAYIQIGRYQEALEIGERALEVDPESAPTLNNVGQALLRLGRTVEALRRFENAIRIEPNFWRARRNQGFAYLALNKKPEAAAAFKMVLRVVPNDRRSKQGLAEARRR